ncbi:MAG: type I polyketide synthase [Mycobacterium sp.]|uniref:type I polyketide synthase n=1 Tax=Mycobacterium sp. TaxID=1785 RepID=UPI001ED746BA|nr:type I polyketide synthase [Mycobacterium sp.]
MTSLADRAAQMSPKAREMLARELVRAGTAFPTDICEPIAVIGMGCRFPGNVDGPGTFWELLVDGRDAVHEVPPDRWDAAAYYDPDPQQPGRMTTKCGGFLGDVAGFDAEFFGISPAEAAAMDPQHRLLVEIAWEALEHAALPPESLAETRTAVIMGLSSWDYSILNVEQQADIDAYTSTGTPHAAAVGRMSSLLGVHGPALAVDTGGSSSLVAVHLACQSLRLRESDLALAGGVQLALSPFASIAAAKRSVLSPTGRCKTFDAAADGLVRGEGCGVVVLKRMSEATADGDRVLAVIRGSAINQSGRTGRFTTPDPRAQREVIAAALRQAEAAADSVSYVETHGTGTPLDDAVELEALAATYGRGGGGCALGAVKTNLGHLEAAAGVAGLIKAILVVSRGYIPRNLHFAHWNPNFDASSTRLFVPIEGVAWPAGSGPRRAAVSAFGSSGTNSHVVIEQARKVSPARRAPEPLVSTLVVSAKTPRRVAAWADALADWIEGPGAATPLTDIAYTLNHRTRYATVAAVVARDHAQAVTALRAAAAGKPAPGEAELQDGLPRPGTVFVYPGLGSEWVGMARHLITDEPAFDAALTKLDSMLIREAGFSLYEVLASSSELVGIEEIYLSLTGMQLALTALWRSYGVHPDLVIGHSLGEVAAAVVAGALTPAEGLRVSAARARLMTSDDAAMDALQSAMRSELAGLSPRTATIPIISTTYETFDTPVAFDAQHWAAANVTNQAHLPQAVIRAGADHHTFIEISTHPLLTQVISKTLGSDYRSVGTLHRDTDDTITFHTQLASIGKSAPDPPGARLADIPASPWQHTRYWIEKRSATPE